MYQIDLEEPEALVLMQVLQTANSPKAAVKIIIGQLQAKLEGVLEAQMNGAKEAVKETA